MMPRAAKRVEMSETGAVATRSTSSMNRIVSCCSLSRVSPVLRGTITEESGRAARSTGSRRSQC